MWRLIVLLGLFAHVQSFAWGVSVCCSGCSPVFSLSCVASQCVAWIARPCSGSRVWCLTVLPGLLAHVQSPVCVVSHGVAWIARPCSMSCACGDSLSSGLVPHGQSLVCGVSLCCFGLFVHAQSLVCGISRCHLDSSLVLFLKAPDSLSVWCHTVPHPSVGLGRPGRCRKLRGETCVMMHLH